ncbi:FGGY family carbohydrate kinase, partial [Nocardia cyriacigeorgica]
VEHNPVEIWERSCAVIQTALGRHGLRASDLAAVGVTNQRETTVLWDRHTGRPVRNAIVWQDTRTEDLVARLAQRPDA